MAERVASRGVTLKSLREQRGFTRSELALLVGVSATTVARYERGDQVPRKRVAAKLARRLGVSIEGLGLNDQEAPQ